MDEVERVARGIHAMLVESCEVFGDYVPGKMVVLDGHYSLERIASAAIAALREPDLPSNKIVLSGDPSASFVDNVIYRKSPGCEKKLAEGQHWTFCGETDMGQTAPALCTECGGDLRLSEPAVKTGEK